MTVKAIPTTPPASALRRNFLRAARGNAIALLLPIAVTPILTRLYAPADFATLGVFSAWLMLAAAVCTWRFDWVVPNARSRGVAAGLATAGAACTAIVSGVAAMVVVVGCSFGTLPGTWLLLPVGVAGVGLLALISGWFIRCNDLTPASWATIARSSANMGVALAAGAARLGALGLVLAATAAAWAGAATMLRRAIASLWRPLRRTTARRIRSAVRKHLPNASWSTLVSLVNAASLHLPVIGFALLYAPREVGWYALMHRVVLAPLGVLAAALGGSFWAHAAEQARAGRIRRLAADYRRVTQRLALAALPVAAACLAGPLLVGPLLGEAEWGGAGWVLLAMTPLFVGSLVFSPTNHLVVLDRQRLQLVADTLRLAGTAVAIWMAHRLELGFVVAVAAVSAASFFGHAAVFLAHLGIHRGHVE